ncbi:tetratricopeptide repeat protein [Spirillospora sp. NPDC047279]|uniref:tetratricopeptide repeat protein n=1 Tax=Spirillospora sp. NPDC047279 TaxID=3155478 RepID=UPI0033F2B789
MDAPDDLNEPARIAPPPPPPARDPGEPSEAEWRAAMRDDLDAALPRLAAAAAAGSTFAARSLGIAMRDRGRYDEAERWYRTGAERDGGCAFGLATLLERLGDPAGAAGWYEKGAALGDLACRTNGALLLAARGGLEEAEERLESAADDGDDVADQALGRMRAFARVFPVRAERLAEAGRDGDPRKAVDAVDDLMDRDEEFRAYGHVADAVRLFDEAAEIAGDDEPLVWKAALLSRLDRWEEAAGALEAAAERFPESGYASYQLGLMARERGECERAERLLRRAADRGEARALWDLAVLCLRMWRLDEAARWYTAYGEQTREDSPRDHEAGLERVGEYRAELAGVRTDRDAERVAALTGAAEAGDTAAGIELAGLLRARREPGPALRWYRAAAERGDAAASLAVGEILDDDLAVRAEHVIRWFLPAAEAAWARGSAATEPDPDDVAVVERAGLLHARAELTAGTELWLRRAARLGHGGAAFWCANKSHEYGDPQEAERLWAVAARGGVAWAGWRAGKSMVLRGAFAEAEPLLRIAWEGRDEEDPLHEAAYWLGRSLRGQERLDEAAEWLRRAVEVHSVVRLGYGGFMLTSLFDPEKELAEVEDALEHHALEHHALEQGER